METDNAYAINQLKGIDIYELSLLDNPACRMAIDRIQRALDALERVQYQLQAQSDHNYEYQGPK